MPLKLSTFPVSWPAPGLAQLSELALPSGCAFERLPNFLMATVEAYNLGSTTGEKQMLLVSVGTNAPHLRAGPLSKVIAGRVASGYTAS
jgi:hypothetical protein